MYFLYAQRRLPVVRQVFHSLVPIQHRRQLQHDKPHLLPPIFHHLQHVRRTVGKGISAPALLVAAGWVKEHHVGSLHPVQIITGIRLNNRCLQPQKREVGRSQSTQIGIPLHVDSFVETPRHPREIHPETARQIDKAGAADPLILQAPCLFCNYGSLIACRQFARTLFHRQVRRINDVLACRPCRHLLPCRLPAPNLLQRQRHVHIRLSCCL